MCGSRLWLAAAVFLVAPILASAQNASVQPRITAAIDNTARTVIQHSTHPLALPAYDTGRLDGGAPMKRMILMLGGSPQQDYDLGVFLDSQQSKGSPDYHNWLTPDQFGQRFGPAPQDIQTVTAWLQQQGFSVDRVARSGKFIQFSGTASQVENAFQTQMHTYRVNGEAHVANAANLSIPTALSPVVRGIASLNNFFPKPSLIHGPKVRRATGGNYEVISSDANLQTQGGTLIHALAPGDFAVIYDLNKLYTATPPLNGSGETIAVVAVSDIIPQDITDFRTIFDLPATTPTNPNIIVDGEDPGDVPGADEEATIDTEWSGAVAPDATIEVVISGDTLVSSGVDLSALFIVDQDLAQIVNVSFNACEANLGGTAAGNDNSFYQAVWQQAAAQSMSVFVSTGDTGAAGCDPNAPAPAPGAVGGVAVSGFSSTPYNTAVGGTEFNETGTGDSVPPNPATTNATFWGGTNSSTLVSALGYIPEMVWNESCTGCEDGDDSLGATGGGLSIIYGVPSWQTLAITGLTGAGFTFRAVPDVALSAAEHDGYIECFQASCEPTTLPSFFVGGGTSFASPSFAGIMAIIDQKIGTPQGLANYVLYSLASKENYGTCNSNARVNPATATACVFNDVTVGNNGVPGNDVTNDPLAGDLGFPAGTGYDLATGLGSVDAFNLVNAWSTAAAAFQGSKTAITASSNPINITHGQNVTLNATVQKAGGGVGPTGNVAFLTDQTVAGIPGISTIEGAVLSGDTATTGSIDFLPGGSYNIYASYPGDGTYGGSVSTKIPVTVSKEASCVEFGGLTPTAANFSLDLTNVPYGTPLAFDTIVTGAANSCAGDGFATGSITSITDKTGSTTTTLTTAALPLNSLGGAEFFVCNGPGTASCFVPGTSTVDANYSGDSSFNPGSTSSSNPVQTVTVMIVKGPTATAVSPSSTTVLSGGMVTLVATVETGSAGLAPTGPASVQFLNNGTVIGTVPLPATRGNPKFPYWLLASAILLYIAYAMSRPRKRRAYAYSGLALVAFLMTIFAGCGGGSGGGGGGGGGGGTVTIGAVTLVSSTNGTATTPASLMVQTQLTTTLKSGSVMVITANYPGDSNYAATANASRTPVDITVQ
jgi:Pro-kumamolisin, activation domain/Bacterial Ig-like domain (group 3)